MPAYNSFEKRSQNSDKQGAIERYYALLGSGHSVGSTSNAIGPIRSKSEHGDTETAEPRQSKIDGALTDVTPEIASAGTAPEKAGCTRGLSVSLSYETKSCRTKEPQAAESAPLNKLGLDDRRQLLRESLPGSEPDAVRPAGAHTHVGREEAICSGDQKRRRFGKFPYVRKWIAFGALYTAIGVSVSIAGFSIVRGGRDAEPTTTRVHSDISSKTEAVAIPGPSADRSEAVVEAQKSQKQVTNAEPSQVHKPSQPAEPAVPGTLQGLAVGVREPGSAVQQEVGAPQHRTSARWMQSSNRRLQRQRHGTRRTSLPRRWTIPLCDSERIGRNGAAFGYGTATGSYTQGRTQGDRDYADQECVGCIAFTTPRCRKTQSEHSTPGCWIQAAYPPADSNKVSVAMYYGQLPG